MKKIFLTTISLVFTLILFSQGTVKFYTNNGTKEISTIKCGDFDNLKVKIRIPSNINNYDMVNIKFICRQIKLHQQEFYMKEKEQYQI